MLGALLNIFRVPELRRKVLITLALIVVYRLGAHVPTPFIDPDKMQEHFSSLVGQGGALAVVDMFSGGAFRNMTVFALGIMPYISASIIIQLLTAVWPRLEKIVKEGESGRRKVTQWTRYGTVALSLFQGLGIGVYLYKSGLSLIPDHPILFNLITAMTMCTGTCFIMWLGEKITQFGIGNGISIIIAAGIVARYPMDFGVAIMSIKSHTMSSFHLIMVVVMMVLVAALIIWSQQANRKIPVQHARRMVGRKMMTGGGTNYIPLKLNTAGVIPVIFASAILTFPSYFFTMMGNTPGSFGYEINNWLQLNSQHNLHSGIQTYLNWDLGGIFNLFKIVNIYVILELVLIYFFCYFYTAITLNPLDLADNLKKSGAFIPGIKPGKHTADYVDHILMRITTVGALILIVIALVPEILYVSFKIDYSVAQMAGGTGLIIVVGVFLDTMKQIESQLMMRHYEGFKYVGAGSGRSGGSRPSVRIRPSTPRLSDQ